MKKIDKLIINSPYVEPQQYWDYIRDTREFVLQQGRRPNSGASLPSKNFQAGLALADPTCYEKSITIYKAVFFCSLTFQLLRTYA